MLCPPHLAEQWQRELRDKFHIDAELVLSEHGARLERRLRLGESLFERLPVHDRLDRLHQERPPPRRVPTRRPELVIVDEAHTCAAAGHAGGGGATSATSSSSWPTGRRRDRHMILVTATPHSGNEEAFRSLVGLLDPSFVDLPEDDRRSTANPAPGSPDTSCSAAEPTSGTTSS